MTAFDGPTEIEYVTATAAPPAGGHYSQAVKHGGLIFISGQLPVCPKLGHRPDRSFEEQSRQAMENLLAVLAAAGGTSADLLKVTVYIVDVQNWPAFNTVYAEILGDARPSRSVVPVPELHHTYLVEIDAIARG